ncbi:hypothetical protein WH50_17110 [Pokkaliibacter plantistimulans]|uniref:HTH cro/C1-type domain-containing protein n=1 Tax=Pokkaliibacter plantistimulans TaxID=1635171 RepID=A0ABX5LTU9_9GAMM|nr:hypothetical protein [Pokkaliibacter plantistimulans]PXF30079.1 hypothetical protein WH50_17110 [Pokkaliibacter plantistimulans]
MKDTLLVLYKTKDDAGRRRNCQRPSCAGQKDMLLRIGMSQQQYQRIESGQDVRLSTLLCVLAGMVLELRIPS